MKKNVSASTQNQAFNSILFLYKNVLNSKLEGLDNTIRAKRGPKLPVVFTKEEVERIFQQLSGKELLLLGILYGAGLRLMELVRLRVKDIDFDSGLIFVRGSKGDKDRTTILPEIIIKDLHGQIHRAELLHKEDLEKGFSKIENSLLILNQQFDGGFKPKDNRYRCPNCGATKIVNQDCQYCGT